MPAARGITPLPARESGKGPGAAARLPWGGRVSPGMEKAAAAPGAAAFGRPGGLRPPGLPNKKLRPVAKPPASAFQGASRPAAAPPRKPRRDSLSAGNVADAPRKRGASAKTPPGDGSKPNIPPFGNVAHGLPLCQQIQQEAFHAVPVGDPQLAQTHVLHQVN